MSRASATNAASITALSCGAEGSASRGAGSHARLGASWESWSCRTASVMTSFIKSKNPVERKPADEWLKRAPPRCLTADCTSLLCGRWSIRAGCRPSGFGWAPRTSGHCSRRWQSQLSTQVRHKAAIEPFPKGVAHCAAAPRGLRPCTWFSGVIAAPSGGHRFRILGSDLSRLTTKCRKATAGARCYFNAVAETAINHHRG